MALEKYKRGIPTSLGLFETNTKIHDPNLYRPSDELIDAVNVSLSTGMPLLLTGEPGTGKTRLAFHLANFFNLGEPLVYNVRTTSAATDLFYRYDSLRHFQYVQTRKEDLNDLEVERRFIQFNALGKAILSQSRRIVLIDEIDKAPRDLPNDLLAAIDELEFEIPEVNRTKSNGNSIKSNPELKPFIILTSNSEKSLPDAFLRRCIYFHIQFPSPDELKEIILPKVNNFSEEELEVILTHFDYVRKTARQKPPATAELVYWVVFLEIQKFPVLKLSNPASLEEDEEKKLLASYTILLKNESDVKSVREALKEVN